MQKGIWSEFAEEELSNNQTVEWDDELFDEIQKGDKVFFENIQGQTCKGTAVMQGPMGWVVNTGNGVPKVVNEGYNYLGHTPA